MHRHWVCSLFFLFQAEDGIRDTSVTGVQTCALPICARAQLAVLLAGTSVDYLQKLVELGACAGVTDYAQRLFWRSEERRVGKECRCGGWWRQWEKRKSR